MATQAALVSVAGYLLGEETSVIRHEYVAGSVYAMSGASRNHVEITSALSTLLGQMTVGRGCRKLDQDTKVWVEAASSYYYPDATVSCPPNFVDDKHGVIDNPTVIFEVLSPATASIDRGAKFAAYRTLPSLRDYVLIESESASVEVYSLQDEQWVVRFYSGPAAIAAIPSVGISLQLDEVYKHVTFC